MAKSGMNYSRAYLRYELLLQDVSVNQYVELEKVSPNKGRTSNVQQQ